ncbi:MAG: dihydrofolate reductase family protein [Reichenbachiella sp.]
MANVQLYIATSIDGYIAREDNSLDWLTEFPNPDQLDYGYATFLEGIDTVIMGRKTYEEILGFGVDWPYPNCDSYVVTTNPDYKIKMDRTFLLNDITEEVISKLRSKSKKNVWLLGGGGLNSTFLNLAGIDEIMLCVIPVILGAGKSLFPNAPKETGFELVNSEAFSTGAIMMTYRKK